MMPVASWADEAHATVTRIASPAIPAQKVVNAADAQAIDVALYDSDGAFCGNLSSLYAKGRVVCIVGRPTCGNTQNAVWTAQDMLDKERFDELTFVVMDLDSDAEAFYEGFAEYLGVDPERFLFASPSSESSGIYGSWVWDMLDAAGEDVSGMVALPFVYMIEQGGEIVHASTGPLNLQTAAENAFGIEPDDVADGIVYLNIAGSYESADDIDEILGLVNEQRALVGASNLTWNADLEQAAQLRASELAAYYSHTRPDNTTCFTAFPEDTGSVGENIAAGYESVQDVHEGWTNSPGHYANMISGDFTSMAAAGFTTSDGMTYWVELFSDMPEKVRDADYSTEERVHSVRISKDNLDLQATVQAADEYEYDYWDSGEKREYAVGDTGRLTMWQYNNCVDAVVESSGFWWESSNPWVVEITSEGVFTVFGEGTATVNVNFPEDPNVSYEFVFRIGESDEPSELIDIADATITPIPDQIYTGDAIYPEYTVMYGDEVLVKGRDYVAGYDDNYDVGIATLTIFGIGDYTGEQSIEFNIVEDASDPIDISDEGVGGILYFESTTYTGMANAPEIVLDYYGDSLIEGTDYVLGSFYYHPEGTDAMIEIDAADLKDAGEYSVLATGKGRFTGEKTIVFFIYPATLTATYEDEVVEYGGTPLLEVTVTGFVNGETPESLGADYTAPIVKAPAVLEPGMSYELVPSGGAAKNYEFEYVGGTLEMEPAPIDIAGATVEPIADRMYSGRTQEPEVSVSFEGEDLSPEIDYVVSYANNVEPGTATVTITGKGDYTGVITVEFTILDTPVRFDGTAYRIVSASDPNFILDVAEVHPTAGANVSIWTSNGGLNQLFTFRQSDDGYIIPVNVANPGLVLDAAGAEPVVGANVSTWTFNDGMNQKWSLIPSEKAPGYYSIASASNPEFVLDAAGAVPEIGANVSIWYSNGGYNQLWKFVSANDISYADLEVSGMERNATGKALKPDITVTLNGKELVEGTDYVIRFGAEKSAPSEPGSYDVTIVATGDYSGIVGLGEFCIYEGPEVVEGASYHLASGFSDSFVLDVAEKHPMIGANVSIWIDNSGDNQLFTLELQADGFYVLRNVANRQLVLDAAGAEPVVGANVSTWLFNDGMNQKWVLIPSEKMEGYYRIASASNTVFVLDAAGAAPEIGANVSIWYDNDGKNQLWKLVA